MTELAELVAELVVELVQGAGLVDFDSTEMPATVKPW
jgi:hypothetical protein